MTALLIIAMLAPEAVLWRFPGPQGETLRSAAVAAQTEGALEGHLLTPDQVDTHLGAVDSAALRQPALMGCFADRGVCDDARRAALPLLNLSSRVDATVARTDDGHVATLTVTPGDPTGSARTYTGAGPSVEAALADAVRALEGQGSVQVKVTPEDARLYLDDKPLGTGSGKYPVPPGQHVLRVEADGFVPLEQTVDVRVGFVVPVSFILGTAYSQLILEITPPEARVYLNGRILNRPQDARDLPPGDYTLRVTADGHVTHDQTVSLKPSTRLKLTIGLPEERVDWFARFQTPHPDTLAHGWYARADLRFVTIGEGPLDVSRETAAGKVEYDTLDDSVGLLGVGIGAGWRGRYLIVDALTFTFEGGGGETPVTLASGREDQIESFSRTTIRPGWVGARYPSWRLEPYILGGIELAFESMEVQTGTKKEELSKSSLLLGVEMGVRAQITPEWMGHIGGVIDFGVESRTAGTFMLGVGYAYDIPELF